MNFVASCFDKINYFAILHQVIWYFVAKLCPRMCMEDRSGNSIRTNQTNSVAKL